MKLTIDNFVAIKPFYNNRQWRKIETLHKLPIIELRFLYNVIMRNQIFNNKIKTKNIVKFLRELPKKLEEQLIQVLNTIDFCNHFFSSEDYLNKEEQTTLFYYGIFNFLEYFQIKIPVEYIKIKPLKIYQDILLISKKIGIQTLFENLKHFPKMIKILPSKQTINNRLPSSEPEIGSDKNLQIPYVYLDPPIYLKNINTQYKPSSSGKITRPSTSGNSTSSKNSDIPNKLNKTNKLINSEDGEKTKLNNQNIDEKKVNENVRPFDHISKGQQNTFRSRHFFPVLNSGYFQHFPSVSEMYNYFEITKKPQITFWGKLSTEKIKKAYVKDSLNKYKFSHGMLMNDYKFTYEQMGIIKQNEILKEFKAYSKLKQKFLFLDDYFEEEIKEKKNKEKIKQI